MATVSSSIRHASNTVCLAALGATLYVYGKILFESGKPALAYSTLFCCWDALPCFAAFVFIQVVPTRPLSSLLMFFLSVLIAAVGVAAMAVLAHNAVPIGTPNVGHCFGPIIEFGAPLVQFAILSLATIPILLPSRIVEPGQPCS